MRRLSQLSTLPVPFVSVVEDVTSSSAVMENDFAVSQSRSRTLPFHESDSPALRHLRDNWTPTSGEVGLNTLCQELIVGLDQATEENVRLETLAKTATAKASAAEARIIYLEAKIAKFEVATSLSFFAVCICKICF